MGVQGDHPFGERCYLSNVCVCTAIRKQGLGKKMMEVAIKRAKAKGVAWLYVHVEDKNYAARALYAKCGFEVEQEETETMARENGKPRRLLLRLDLHNK